MREPGATVIVIGAGGLIGQAVVGALRKRGVRTIALARRLTAAQRGGADDVECPVAEIPAAALQEMLEAHEADLVVNCLGVLQDGAGSSTQHVHVAFVQRLVDAIRATRRQVLLAHLSVPGEPATDRTRFSHTKREAEAVIAGAGIPFAILRPGFVWAPAAFGGSAMLRAIAALPFDLPEEEAASSFATVAVEDIAATIHHLVCQGPAARNAMRVTWDLMSPEPTAVGDVVSLLRRWLGTLGSARIRLPRFALQAGCLAGDAASWLGWAPPIRTTALREMRRGVRGDPKRWMHATGIVPSRLADVLRAAPATVQEKWFARLYLLKGLIVASLSVFWIASGLIAITVAYSAAADILRAHRFPDWMVDPLTVGTSLMDISIGCAIAVRPLCKAGLIAGIVASLGYMAGAAVLTPDLWIEPLGALVKTFPAIVLMIVALAMLDQR